jgi:phosphatidylinositol alpha-1,6-mannosyltransferase
MPILLVSPIFPPRKGGVAVVYGHLCRHLGRKVTVLAPREGENGVDRFDAQQTYRVERTRWLAIRRITMLPRLLRAGLNHFMNNFVLRLGLRRKLRSLIARTSPGVVCIGDFRFYWLLPVVRRLCGAPVVFYIHGEEVCFSPRATGMLSRHLQKSAIGCLRQADGIVVVSRFTQGKVLALGTDPSRVKLVYSGVDHVRFTPGPSDSKVIARHGLTGKRVILTVARLDARKGHETVIKALPTILSRVPEAIYLIVGQGPERDRLARLVAELQLETRVVFAGVVADDELCAYYRTCDVFVQPNYQFNGDNEGFGLVFLEAAACGCAVVAGRAGGVPEAVKDGETGLLVDGTSVEQTSDAISRLLLDANLRSEFSRNGINWARRFHWQATANAFTEFCDEMRTQGRSTETVTSSEYAAAH